MSWVKSHKLAIVLLLFILYLLLGSNLSYLLNPRPSYSPSYGATDLNLSSPTQFAPLGKISTLSFQNEASSTGGRLVIQDTYMSLLVKDVKTTQDQIVKFAESKGGSMVQTSTWTPDESSSGTVVVRVPRKELDGALKYFRTLAVKVTNENIMGTDVTDTYVDIEERLATLRKTKAKFEDILDKATQVQDILSVQRELTNIQVEIDSLVGQQKVIDKNVELTKITLNLSTDELSLPYVPDKSFRPNLIFKQAVRSLVETLRSLGTLSIWAAVFSVIWVPIAFVVYLFRRRLKSSAKK